MQAQTLPSVYADVLNPTGMYGRVELVTPEMAQKYLATMPEGQQRTERQGRVKMYSRSHEAGEWRLTHQGIGFDPQGRLRDGQHRLRMVVLTGKPACLFVVRNVPLDGFLHCDENLPRSVRDALKMAAKGDYANSVLAVARILLLYPSGYQYDAPLSKEHYLRVLRTCATELEFAEANLQHHLGCTRSVRALVARAYHHAHPDRLVEFCKVLGTGFVSEDHPRGDQAAVAYRNFLLRPKSVSGGTAVLEWEKYAKGQTALQAFLGGEPLTKVYGTDKDLFPIPDLWRVKLVETMD